MHGMIFAELKKYVVARHGGATWNTLLDAAGFHDRIFLPNTVYPDADLVAIVGAASKLTGQDANAIVEDFGAALAPDLLQMYRAQLKPDWKTLDVIQNTEILVHRAVRVKMPGAEPPHLTATRPSADKTVIEYSSPRRLCRLAIGISKGIAAHFGERIAITQPRCMLEGAPSCQIVIERIAAHA